MIIEQPSTAKRMSLVIVCAVAMVLAAPYVIPDESRPDAVAAKVGRHPPTTTHPTGTVAPATEPEASTTPAPGLPGGTGTEGNDERRVVAPTQSVPASPAPSTTTTSSPAPPVPTTAPGVEHQAGGEIRHTSSTVYCISGTTYSGDQTNAGPPRTVAVNRDNGEWERYAGTTWKVLDGPHAGAVYVVQDAGTKAHFDMWHGDRPDCRSYALGGGGHPGYGIKTIRVQRVA